MGISGFRTEFSAVITLVIYANSYTIRRDRAHYIELCL